MVKRRADHRALELPMATPNPLEAAIERVKEALQDLDADNDDRADEGEHPVEDIDVNASDLRLILAALEARGKALEEIASECDPADPDWFSQAEGRANIWKACLTALGGSEGE